MAIIKAELGGSIEDLSKIEGILLLKGKDADKKQKLLDAFDFRKQDKDEIKNLVEDINQRIADLNSERYSLNMSLKNSGDLVFNDTDSKQFRHVFVTAGVVIGKEYGKVKLKP